MNLCIEIGWRFRRCAAACLAIVLLAAAGLSQPGCSGSEAPVPSSGSPGAFSFSQFNDPPAEFRPWVRWWWPGGDVLDDELCREIRLLADNGFGGAEIQPFDAALNPDVPADELDRRRSFDSEAYYRHLLVTLEEALRQGIRIDLNLGSGWPSGGVHIRPEESQQTLLWSERAVTGPGLRTVDLSRPDKPVFYLVAEVAEKLFGERMARYEGGSARLEAVVGARVTGGARAGCPLDLSDHVDLAPASVQVLTTLVDASGVLTWEAPAGDWRVIGIYAAPDGEYPLLNAQPEPGYVADHLDRDRMRSHLEHLLGTRTGFAPFYGGALRGLFNDSLEFKAERLFASDLLEQFQARRGYDLTPWLPAVLVPAADNFTFDTAAIKRGPEFFYCAEDHRIRYDYALTVSDLFIERFVEGASAWAADRGLCLRAQSYGLQADILRAAGAACIPEAEQLYAGGSETFLKMVSSGAMLYGRSLASAESLVWIGRAYMETPLKIKTSADKMFVSGINHLVFHGFPYRKNHDYGETGWHPFASPFGGLSVYSSNISETSPFWPNMKRINRYLSRCQYALRQGRPAADVLIYYPWLGFQTTLAAQADLEEFLLNGQFGDLEPEVGLDALLQLGLAIGLSEIAPQVTWIVRLQGLLQELDTSGYTWGWVNDERLQQARFEAGDIRIGENRFKAVLVDDSPEMQVASAEMLAVLAGQGAAVLLVGDIPREQPGFSGFVEGDARVVGAMERVMQGGRVRRLAVREGAAHALRDIGAGPAIRFTAGGDGVRYLRRDLGGAARLFFFENASFRETRTGFEVEGGCPEPRWVDVWEESLGPLAPDGEGAFELSMPALASGLLICGLPGVEGLLEAGFAPRRMEETTPGRRIPLENWTLDVQGEDVPGGSVHLVLSGLPDWRELDDLRYSSSHGIYRAEFSLGPLGPGETAWLQAGWVHGTAEVRVNGREAGTLLAPPFRVEIGRFLQAGLNRIEIEVTPALRNRLEGKARQGDQRYREFTGREEMLLPGGIEGPVGVEIRPRS